MTTSRLDEMMAAASARAAEAQHAREEREARERVATKALVRAKAEEVFSNLLGADLYAELGVEVRAEKYPTSAEQYYGVGSFAYADEWWHLKYDDQAGRYGAPSAPVLIVDVPGLPDDRRWDAKRRHGEQRITSHYDTKLLVLLAWYAEDRARQLMEREREQKAAEERAERARREEMERQERVKREVEDAKAAEVQIISEAEAFFAEKRAGMWRWPTGYVLTLYRWRWCIGASSDGDVEFDEAWSLSLSLSLGEWRDDSDWLVTFEQTPRTLKLISEAHKPVVERHTFSQVGDLTHDLYHTVRVTYGADSIRRKTVGEWPNAVDVWTRAEEGEWGHGIERTIGYTPVKWLATFIDSRVGADAPRDPLPPMDEDAERPYVEDMPF